MADAWLTDARKRHKTEHPYFAFFEVSYHPSPTVLEYIAMLYSAVVWPAVYVAILFVGLQQAFFPTAAAAASCSDNGPNTGCSMYTLTGQSDCHAAGCTWNNAEASSLSPSTFIPSKFRVLAWALAIAATHEFSRHAVKPCFRQLRPARSLARKPWGFPSNHACVATLESVLMLNYALRTVTAGTAAGAFAYGTSTLYTHPCFLVPLLCCAPVLPSRVVLGDHTVGQIAGGAALGAAIGVAAIVGGGL